MKIFCFAVFSCFALAASNVYAHHASIASALYDPVTGQISVSVQNVNNWYIESASNSFTRDEPLGLPAASGLVTNNDTRIGEANIGIFSYDLNLGKVAKPGLRAYDLTLHWNPGFGQPAHSINFGPDPPLDFARINGPFVIDTNSDPLNITLDASGSLIDGPILDYSWDLDGQPGFEIENSPFSFLRIENVIETFGGIGVYPVTVGVGFFEGFDTATTTVTIIPEPATWFTACLGLGVVFIAQRRRIPCSV